MKRWRESQDAWLIRNDVVTHRIGITPLSGTTSEQHMKHDVEVIAMKDFGAQEVEAVLNLIQ